MNKRNVALFAGLAALCLAAVAVLLWQVDTSAPAGSTTALDTVIPMATMVQSTGAAAGGLPYITHEVLFEVPVTAPSFLLTPEGILTIDREDDGQHYALFWDGRSWAGLSIPTEGYSIAQLAQSEGKTYILSLNRENALHLDIVDENGQTEVSAQYIDSTRTLPDADAAERQTVIQEVHQLVIFQKTLYILSTSWGERITCHLRSYDLETLTLNDDPYPNISGYKFERGFAVDSQGNLYFSDMQYGQGTLYKLSPSGDFESFPLGATFPIDIACHDDRLYLLTTERVSIYTLEGQLVEHMVTFAEDVTLVLFGMPLGFCQWLDVQSPDALMLLFVSGNTDTEQGRLVQVTRQWVETLPPEPEKTQLVFTMPYPSVYLMDAIRLYEVIHPDMDIVVEAMSADAEGALKNALDISTQLATKLLTGKAGDLYAMGGEALQYHSLLKTDAFVDLTDRLTPLRGDIYEHMLDGIRVNGTIRALPVGMEPRGFIYDVEWGESLGVDFDPHQLTASTLIEIAAAMQRQGDTRSPVGYSYEYFFNEVILANLYDLIDPETYTFDLRQPWFLDLMEAFKEVYIPAVEGKRQSEYLFDLQMQIDGEYYGLEYTLRQGPRAVRIIPDMKSELSGFRATRSQYLYAIPSASDHQEEAWAFLAFLASQAGQYSFTGTSLSNIEAEEAALAYLAPETRADVVAITGSVTHLHSIYHAEFDIIVPLREYLLGNTTLDEALRVVEYILTLRFSE